MQLFLMFHFSPGIDQYLYYIEIRKSKSNVLKTKGKQLHAKYVEIKVDSKVLQLECVITRKKYLNQKENTRRETTTKAATKSKKTKISRLAATVPCKNAFDYSG